MEAVIRGAASLALLAGAFVHYERDPTWWLYVPSYALAGLVCFIPFPNNSIWRLLSAISVVGGGLLMLFLWWTFSNLDQTAIGFRPVEAKGLFPISVGVALSCLTRLSTDPIQKPTHYVRSLLHASLLAVSLTLVASSGKYFHYKSY